MTRYLLDTNALSELAKRPMGKVEQRVRLVGPGGVCTSIIAAAEVRYGADRRKSPRLSAQVEAILGLLPVRPWGQPADRAYALLRSALETSGTPIGQMDMLIAAHAFALNCILVTDNEREFSRVPGLTIENWLRIP